MGNFKQKFKAFKENVLSRKKQISVIVIILVAIGLVTNLIAKNIEQANLLANNPELAKAMTYDKVQDGDEIVEGTDGNVKFDAFFLRDLNGDGVAESIRGTSRQVGTEDTLYMEINVDTAGYLEEGKIAVNGNNFYLQTALPKDNELKENYVGSNIKIIEFNTLNNGTQKMLTGIVRSGDYSYNSKKNEAIGNNINNYSQVNSITFTGTYVKENGERIPITKTVNFNIDWYGTTKANIPTKILGDKNLNQEQDINTAIDEEAGTFTVDFSVGTQEIGNQLNLSKAEIQAIIPELSGYAPTKVEASGTNVKYTYDSESKKLIAQREAIVDSNGNITSQAYNGYYDNYRYNKFNIRVTYPIEAFQEIGTDTVDYRIPITAYYEGFNNRSGEFTNPYRSDEAQATFAITIKNPTGSVAIFDVTVGKYLTIPTKRYIVSKQNVLRNYNGISNEEDDTYQVRWEAYTGSSGDSTGIVMKETRDGSQQMSDNFVKTDSSRVSMEDMTANVGIGFSGANSFLNEDGWIKVYDDETGDLLVTFTKDDWNRYTSGNPYMYELPVKHIRVETSNTNASSRLYVYNIKKLDDEYIVNNFEKEEFDSFQYIQSNLVGYIGGSYINTDIHQANYESPYSVAEMGLSNNAISTQSTEKNEKMIITTKYSIINNQEGWVDGSFLVKLPKEIIDAQINDIQINNNNIELTSYELIEKDGYKLIKINTNNKEETPETYSITVDVDLTSDPRIPTTNSQIELYASNKNASDYYYSANDIYDVNDNLNTSEKVNRTTTGISMISPNSLLTSQIGSNFDDKGTEVVSPQIADIKPSYAVVDQGKEKKATIGVQMRNNYSSTISEIVILGKIPFEGNTYALNGGDLGSNFTTKMTNTGITVPEDLRQYTTVYYSENENPDKDLAKSENGWKTADQVTNWDNIRTYLIDLGSYIMPTGAEYVFNYTVTLPNGLDFNQVAYSHHGVYFSLDTEQGKYRTQTEPNKLGLRIAEKFNLELTKNQVGRNKLVAGATYSVTDEETGESKSAVTNSQGVLTIYNLYAEKTYALKEIKTPDDYELSSEVIRFITHVDDNGNLTVEKLSGTTNEDMQVVKEEGQDVKVTIKVQDEAKASLKITKKEQGTDNKVQFVRFKLTGNGLPENGRILTTNVNGEANFKGLSINQEYTLQETKAEGYYLADPITFKVVNDNGTYKVETTTGTISEQTLTEEDSIPTVNMTLENEKKPTYNLHITKIKKTTESTLSEDESTAQAYAGIDTSNATYLEGAKFKLYKGTELLGEYTTDNNGNFTINNLYQFIDGKNEDGVYTLKEVLAPEGYARVEDITFKVDGTDGTLKLVDADGTEKSNYTVDGNTIKLIVEDNPSFRLVKKDADTKEPLANVKFAIYNIDNDKDEPAMNSQGEILGTKEIINGREYYTVTTDQNGEITAELTEGLYKAVELQAPEQYDVTNQTYYFGIGASREAKKGLVETWADTVGENGRVDLYSITETSDGGYVVGGSFWTDEIKIGDEIFVNNSDYWEVSESKYSDALLIKYDREGSVEWTDSFGGNESDNISSVVATSDGGFIAGGDFSGTIQLGNETLVDSTGSGNNNGLIVKYNSEGEVEWATNTGAVVSSIEVTSDGGYIVGGSIYVSSIQVGNEILINNGEVDGFIAKFNGKGEVEWAKAIGGDNGDYINAVTQTNDGGYIVGGQSYSDEFQVGSETIVTDGTGYNGIIIKYDEKGEVEWAESIENSIGEIAQGTIDSVVATNDGGVIVGGSCLAKYNKDGEQEWIKHDYASISSVRLTNDGKIIVGGYKYVFTAEGNYTINGIIIKYDEKGEVEWTKEEKNLLISSIISTSDSGIVIVGTRALDLMEYSGGVVVNYEMKSVDNPIVTNVKQIRCTDSSRDYVLISSVKQTSDGGYIAGGYFSGTIQVGNEELTSNGNCDGLIVKYNSSKQVEWVKSFGKNGNEQIYSVASTSDGGCIVGGSFTSSTIQVGNETIINHYDNDTNIDAIIIKYSAEGEVEWVNSFGSDTSFNEIHSVATTKDGGYIAGGNFQGKKVQVGNETLEWQGGLDCVVIKYDAEGKVEWTDSFGTEDGLDGIQSVAGTSDGGVIVGGFFEGSNIQVGNDILTNNSSSANYGEGLIIKYNSEGVVEWAKSFGGSDNDNIYSVEQTNDGGYIAGGYSGTTMFGGYEPSNGSSNGVIIKYDSKGEVEWERAFGESSYNYIYSVLAAKDGGYIAGGDFTGTIQVGSETLTSNGDSDGIIIKYDKNGNVEYTKQIGGSGSDSIFSVDEIGDEQILAGGSFSSTFEVDGHKLENQGDSDGMILEVVNQVGIPEVEELVIENSKKEFNITTDVNEINGVKGGTISGEDENPFETVKYGENSTEKITMTPDNNYEIIGITVNGEEWPFEVDGDGAYTMPLLENVTEDKHIVVTYALKENKIVINKIDSEDGTPLPGATFKIDQVDETTDTDAVIGSIVANGNQSVDIEEGEELEEVLGNLTSNGLYYFKENSDGTLIPINGKTYQVENGGYAGIGGVTANSYIPIDLTGRSGEYVVVVNARVSSETADRGYATITQSTVAPAFDNSEGRFMYISGDTTSSNTPTDYTSMVLEGGKTYYLHLGYRKDNSIDTGEDQVVINSVKVYKSITTIYSFVDNGKGGYESNNKGLDNTTANSYIPIDLRDYTGTYNLTVNANISSQISDYGYATITNDTNAPAYNRTEGRFIIISGTGEDVTTPTDYTTVLQGGQMYYLHFGYYKNSSASNGDDKFTINSIKLSLDGAELYHTEVTTNSEGQAITQLPFGKYQITEIKAPDGYELNSQPTIVEFRESGTHEFTIENTKKAQVLVHHYLKTEDGKYTTTKVAEDDLLEGKVGESYSTSPKLDLNEYELEKDENGEYVLPEKAAGTYKNGIIEVTYYYEKKEIPLTVHHYIEGTEEKVPLKDGSIAEDVIDSGKEGDNYQTNAIEDSYLSDDYELVETPGNANGIYSGDEVIVTYFYKKVERKVVINKYDEDKITPLEGVTFDIASKETPDEILGTYTTNEKGQIEVTLKVGEYIATEIEVPEGYDIPEENETEFSVTKENDVVSLDIANTKTKGTVITHYYIEGTEEKVPNKEGEVVEDVIQKGNVGDIYATKEAENVAPNYDFISTQGKTSGTIVEGTTEVIYYYRVKEPIIESPVITKESNLNKITDVEQTINYTMNYKATINTYIGNATVTIVDELPYEIDESKTYELNGGIYNKENKTITWIEKIGDIDTFVNGAYNIDITKEISLVYKDIDTTINSISNKVKGMVNLETPEKEETTEDTEEIPAEYLINIPVSKVWKDNENIARKRPSSVNVLVKNGTEEVARQELSDNNEWTYTFKGLDKYDEEGRKINYTIEEQEVNTNDLYFYNTNVNGSMETGFVVTNTFEVPDEKVVVDVNKTWVDTELQQDKRPTGVTVVLMNGNQVAGKQELSVTNNWSYTFENLAKYDSLGNEINYTVQEVTTNKFYTSQVLGDMKSGYTVINTFQVPDETIDLTVNKVWDDNGNVANKRPESVTLKVTGDGETKTQVVTAENTTDEDKNKWKYTFIGLPKYDENGNEIEYTVDEEDLNNEFYQKTDVNQETKTITNTFQVPGEKVEIRVTKEWNDNEDAVSKRPENVTLQLKNGSEIAASEVVDAEDNWTHVFSVKKYDELGNPINYTADEAGTGSKFYVKENVTGDMSLGFTVTNKFEVPDEKTEVLVVKKWDDNNNQAQKRPESIILKLTGSDGKEYTQELNNSNVVIDDTNRWEYTFRELPKYDDRGDQVTYTLSEEDTGSIFYTKANTVVDQESKTVTNKFVVPNDKIEIPVTKVWMDTSNLAQKRPKSITVKLTGSDGQEYTQELGNVNATEENSDNWTYTFRNLPKYNSIGDEITYTLSEEDTESIFYTEENTNIVGDKDRGFTVTNRFEVPDEKVAVDVSKTWVDTELQKDKRPTGVMVVLKNGDNEAGKQELSEANGWKYTFENLDKYDSLGNEINYTVEEVTTNKFYTSQISGSMKSGYTITNTFTNPEETTEVTVNKVWNDNNDEAQKRPESVTLKVTGDGKTYTQNVTEENAEEEDTNKWPYTFTGLPKYDANGNEIKYTVDEENLNNEFYQKTDVNQETRTIINTFQVPGEEVEVRVTKDWNDNENAAKKRPENVTLQVKKGNEVVASEVVDAEENWTHIFKVNKYDELGNPISYTADETSTGSKLYVKENVTGDMNLGFTVTNRLEVPDEKVTVDVNKIWVDTELQQDKRPTGVTVVLMNGEQEVESQELSNANNWSYTFTNLDKYDSLGNEINYKVKEVTTNKFYTSQISGDMESGYTITNTFTKPEETTEITVNKVWADNENVAGKRPESVTLKVTGNGKTYKQEVNGSGDTWTYTFTGLPKYDENGNEIEYTVDEEELIENAEFYLKSVDQEKDTITNTFTVPGENITVKATKAWEDNENVAGKRPESVTIQVKEGEAVVATEEANEENNWTVEFTVPKYDSLGKEIEYTVAESETGSVFYIEENTDISGDMETGFTITNTFEVPGDTVEVPVTKVWDDNSNLAGKRPESVTIKLTGSDGKVYTQELSNTNAVSGNTDNWTYTFRNLPKYDSLGNEVIYTLSEEATGSIFYTEANTVVDQESKTVTNKFVVPDEKIEIPVTKIWMDTSDIAGKRPESITLKLTGSDGSEKTQELTEANVSEEETDNWTYTFTNLPKYDSLGNEIVYTLSEEDTGSIFYTAENTNIVGDKATGFRVTNRFEVPDEKVVVNVSKTWVDTAEQQDKRPSHVTVQLKANGQDIEGKTIELNTENEWKGTFANLAKYDSLGNEINYTVEEKDSGNIFYTVENSSVSGNMESGYVITNTFEVPNETVDLTVNKVWVDNENEAGKRPASVTLKVTGNGNTYKQEVNGSGDTWTYTFENLPKYDSNGNEIEYTVDEEALSENSEFYLKSVDQERDTITNTFTVPGEKVTVKVTKVWNDSENEAKKRPERVTVQVKNGENVVASEVANAENNWTVEMEVPKYDSLGNEINYTIDEADLGNIFYVKENSEISGNMTSGYTITNKFVVPDEKVSVNVSKQWIDTAEQQDKRPNSVTVVLKANGVNVPEKTLELNEENEWNGTFTELAKYDSLGNIINYTVEEQETNSGDLKFYTNSVSGDMEDGYVITNTFTRPEDTINIIANKLWNDTEEQSVRRPESITLVVKNGEEEVQSKVVNTSNLVPGTTNKWTVEFTGLDKYDSDGNEIEYTLEERETNEGDLHFYEAEENNVAFEDNQATIRNNFVVPDDTTSVKVTKVWNDNSDVNGRRPESIEIKVSGNGNEYSKVVTSNDKWTHTFTDLPKYDVDGKEIVYTASESEVNSGDLKFYTNDGVSGDMVSGYTIENTFTVPDDKVELTVNKVWEDNDIQSARRPSVVVINVLGEEGVIVASHELNVVGGEESYTFTDLPKYNRVGQEIEYRVEETEKNPGDLHFYTVVVGNVENVDGNEDKKEVTITNTFEKPEDKIDVTITKVWDDNSNGAKKRPESIMLLLKDGSRNVDAQKVDVEDAVEGDANRWEYTFTGLDKYNSDGQEIVYTADEAEVASGDLKFYNKSIEGLTVTNTFTQDTTKVSVPVTKVWVDTEEQEARRPESVIIILKANDEEVQRVEVRGKGQLDKDRWQYTFENLPKYDENNDIINYTVEEAEKSPGDLDFYSSTASGTTITNTFTRPTDTISLEVNKVWEDQEDSYGKRPVSVRVNVKGSDGTNKTAIITKDGNWTYTFEDLLKYDNEGKEVEYIVYEEEVMENDLFYYTGTMSAITDKEGEANAKEVTITNKMTKIPGTVVVKYVDKNSKEEISERITHEGPVGDTYDVTEDEKEIPGYTLVEEPEEKTGEYTAEEQEKIYYYAKNTSVLVKYLEKDDTLEDDSDNKVLAKEVLIEGYEGKGYTTNSEDIDGYTLVETKGNTVGTMTEEQQVVVYYYSKDTKVIVKYLEKDATPENPNDNEVLAPEEEIEGYVGKDYTTTEKVIPGYTLIEKTRNYEGTMTEEVIEVIYYYSKNTSVIVKYLEKDTNKELADEVLIEGYEGKEYETEQKEIENYTFVEDTENTSGTMTKEQIEVIYYYAQNTKAKVEHIDRETGKILKEETEEGKVGDLFETHPEDFEGYVLVEEPEEPNIIMDKTGEQVVKYYYENITAGVIEKHIDVISGELLYSKEHKGYEGDKYSISSRTFEGYDLVENKLPENSEGTLEHGKAIEVKYYYIKKASVVVKYVDENTGEEIAEEERIEGHENDPYDTEEKEIDDYEISKVPDNASGTMTVIKNPDGTYDTETEVIYYYKKTGGIVIENHIDVDTDKVLATEEHEGNVGDKYDIPSREFSGYDLVIDMLPDNSKGEMTEEEIVVNYYYKKKSKVTVEYIDKETGEKLDEDEINGHIGDEYSTEEKKFDGYDLIEKPSNGEGEMTEEEIIVKYYYSRKAEVEVKYLEKGTEYEVAERENLKGHVGDKYETEAKDVPYYRLVEKTENWKGKMTKDKITVIYYYEKQIFNLGVDKWVGSVSVNGMSSPAQSISSSNDIYKIDIHRTKAETADIRVTYKIRITNKGEIEGSIGKLTDIIPAAYEFYQEDNSITWVNENGVLTTEDLKDEEIKPGEYKEIEVTLRVKEGSENFGQKDNMVILTDIDNPAGYEDIDKEDNRDTSSMIITIATGLDRNDRILLIAGIEIVILITLGIAITYKKKERHN